MADELTDRIRNAAAGPAGVTSDGTDVRQQPLKDLIDADEHLSRKAVKDPRKCLFRFFLR